MRNQRIGRGRRITSVQERNITNEKLLTLILAILLAFNMFACGRDAGVEAPPSTDIDCAPEADDTSVTENWEEAAKNGVVAVYITINPEIKLIIDEGSFVVTV